MGGGIHSKDPNRMLAFLALGLMVLCVFSSLLVYIYPQKWSGFSGRTLWEWLDLLLLPSVIVALVPLINMALAKSDRRRRQNEEEVALARHQDEILRSYFDRMTELILDKRLDDEETEDEQGKGGR
jgi:hypothetical protein